MSHKYVETVYDMAVNSEGNVLEIIALDEEETAGYMLVSLNPSGYTLECIRVLQDYDITDVTEFLLDGFIGRLSDESILPLSMLYPDEACHEESVEYLLKRPDFYSVPVGTRYRIDIKALWEQGDIKKMRGAAGNDAIRTLRKCQKPQLIELMKLLSDKGLGNYRTYTDFMRSIDPDTSCVYISQNGIKAGVITLPGTAGEKVIESIFSDNDSRALLGTIAAAAENIYKKDENIRLVMLCINDASRKFAEHVFRGLSVTGEEVSCLEWSMLRDF